MAPRDRTPAARVCTLGCCPSPSVSHKSEDICKTQGSGQLLAHIPHCQHDPYSRHSLMRVHSHLGCTHSWNPLMRAWYLHLLSGRPKKPLSKTTQRYSHGKRVQEQEPAVYTCTFLFIRLSRCLATNTAALPTEYSRFRHFQCRSRFGKIHLYSLIIFYVTV